MSISFKKINSKLLIILLLSLGWQCQSSPSNEKEIATEERFEEKKEKGVTLPDGRVKSDTLQEVKDLSIKRGHNKNRTYYHGDELFNGTAIQMARGHQGYLEYSIKEGIMVRMKGYYENGQLERNFPFKDGKSHGRLLGYYEDGKKYIEENYKMGQLEGPQFRWYEEGQLWREAEYKEGKLVREKLYAKDGFVMKEFPK